MELSLSLLKEQKEDQAEAEAATQERLARLETGFLQSTRLQTLESNETQVESNGVHSALDVASPTLFDSRRPSGPTTTAPLSQRDAYTHSNSLGSPQPLSARRLHELREAAHQKAATGADGGLLQPPDGTPRWQTVSFSADADSSSEYASDAAETPPKRDVGPVAGSGAARERGWSVLDDAGGEAPGASSPAGKVYFE